MTVSELRKKLKGVNGKLPVYWADHDHGTYEWNNKAGEVKVLDQKNADPWDEIADEFKIKGKYLLITP